MPETLAITATVTPDGGGAFPLQQNGLYHLVEGGTSQGASSWRRIIGQSNYVPGRSIVHAVPDVEIGQITVRVFGDPLSTLLTNINNLIDNFRGFNYAVSISFEGFQINWVECEPADVTLGSTGDAFSGPHFMAGQQTVNFQVPHLPGWA